MRRRWSFVSSAFIAYLDKCNRFSEELGARAHPVCRLQIWKIAPWILVVIGAVLGESFCDNACEPKIHPSQNTKLWINAFNLLNNGAPAATLVVRLLAGLVFFAEEIKNSCFPPSGE